MHALSEFKVSFCPSLIDIDTFDCEGDNSIRDKQAAKNQKDEEKNGIRMTEEWFWAFVDECYVHCCLNNIHVFKGPHPKYCQQGRGKVVKTKRRIIPTSWNHICGTTCFKNMRSRTLGHAARIFSTRRVTIIKASTE